MKFFRSEIGVVGMAATAAQFVSVSGSPTGRAGAVGRGNAVLAARQCGIPSLLQPAMVLEHNFADPSLVYDPAACAYYSFSTANGKYSVQMAQRNPSTSKWDIVDVDAFPNLGAWVANGNVWAPDVQKISDNSWAMYYSAPSREDHPEGQGKRCVGVAMATSVRGPFTGLPDPLGCWPAQGGSIDAAGFYDPNTNTRWVTYKIDGNAVGPSGGACGNEPTNGQQPASTFIMLQQVGLDGFTKIGQPTWILDRDASDGPLVEAPQIVYEGGMYILFYSSHCYSTTSYDVAYATASSVNGPYTKAAVPLLRTPDFPGLVGPGGASSNGAGYLVWHSWSGQNGNSGTGSRYMWEGNYQIQNGVLSMVGR